MNKKGLIFIFLFVVSAVSVVAFSNAATNDNKIDVTLNYVPSAYVPMDELYVEIDSRILDDNMVFGENDDIYFSFFYDVCIETWGGAVTTGGGIQPEVWFYEPQNNWTEGYTGTDLYNTTRFVGTMNVMLDDYDLGMTNFDIGTDVGTYQNIVISLDLGWHYLTIVAAELVSDGNHTTFHWEYMKDEKRFFVAQYKEDLPIAADLAYYNTVDVTATAVNSEDLPGQAYNITSFVDSPRAVAETVLGSTIEDIAIGEDGSEVSTSIEVAYNASDNPLILADGPYGLMYGDLYSMGPLAYMWIINDGNPFILNSTYTPDTLTGLRLGLNYIYFVLFGFRVDDYSQLYGNPAPQLGCDLGIFRLTVGDPLEVPWIDPCPVVTCPPETTGPGFGIFISVSIVGLAAALIVRRRK